MKRWFLLFLILLVLPTWAGAADTYYFDSISGNDNTGAANDTAHPYQTLTKLNTLIENSTIKTGDNIAFKKGTTLYQQVFRVSIVSLDYAPANLTFASYGSGSYKPILRGLALTFSGAGPVYTLSTSNLRWLFEDYIPLPQASSSACSDGNWYFDGATTAYYKPTDGVNNHILDDRVGPLYCESGNGITVNGIGFVCGGPLLQAYSGNLSNVTFTDCAFWNGATLSIKCFATYLVDGVTITNNTFVNLYSSSIYLAGGDGSIQSGIDNITISGNTITNSNMLLDGSPWNVGTAPDYADLDIIYGQNWGTALVESNEISGGYVGLGYFSAALEVFNFVDGIHAVSSYTNSGGLFYVTAATALNINTDDYVFIYGVTGAGAPNGKWKITVTDTTHFTLQGSTYAAGCSGGTVYRELPVTPNYAFRNNYIHDVRNGFFVDLGSPVIGATNHTTKIYNNILARCPGYGINICRVQASPVTSYVYNNSLIDCGTLVVVETVPPDMPGAAIHMDLGDNLTIKNNIVSGACNLFAYDLAATGNNVWDYNCYSDASSGSIFKWGATLKTLAQWKTATGGESHSITTDPKFGTAGTVSDFQIPSTSPCFRAGTLVGLTTDYWGNGWHPTTPDIGAYSVHRAGAAIGARQY